MAEVKFKRAPGNTELPLPNYATAGAAGMDLRAFLPDGPMTFLHGQVSLLSVGFSVELPRGIIMVGLYYIGDAPFVIRHGDRIAQAVIADVRRYALVEVDELSDSTRGASGFGSTGLK